MKKLEEIAKHAINQKITKLSVITNSFFKTDILLEVPPSSFDIPPRTNSFIVKMVKINKPLSKKYKIYKELFYLDEKKIHNSLMETFIKLDKLTKRTAKEYVNSLELPSNILENTFKTLSNEDLKVLDEALETHLNFEN